MVELLKASGETNIHLVTELEYSIVSEGVVPADLEVSSIVNSYKGKGNALEQGNHGVLKHVRKVVERIIEASPRKDKH